ncbi:hypothetical protein GCM10010177_48680 [Actinomadura citrea]|nr:hypothetical protein GCM10010177_48680 [Actinomadura citrea]
MPGWTVIGPAITLGGPVPDDGWGLAQAGGTTSPPTSGPQEADGLIEEAPPAPGPRLGGSSLSEEPQEAIKVATRTKPNARKLCNMNAPIFNAPYV